MNPGAIHPLASALAAGPQSADAVARQQARRLQRMERAPSSIASEDEYVERPVEDASAVEAPGDPPEHEQQQRRRNRTKPETPFPRLDLTA